MHLDEERVAGCAYSVYASLPAGWCFSYTCVNRDRHPMVALRFVLREINGCYPPPTFLYRVVVLKQKTTSFIYSVLCFDMLCIELNLFPAAKKLQLHLPMARNFQCSEKLSKGRRAQEKNKTKRFYSQTTVNLQYSYTGTIKESFRMLLLLFAKVNAIAELWPNEFLKVIFIW